MRACRNLTCGREFVAEHRAMLYCSAECRPGTREKPPVPTPPRPASARPRPLKRTPRAWVEQPLTPYVFSAMWGLGYSAPEIMRELGLSSLETVRRWRDHLKLPLREAGNYTINRKEYAVLNGAFEELTRPSDTPLTTEQKLDECYQVLCRVAYGSGKPGNRPLAGGVEDFTKKFLTRHNVAVHGSKPVPTCPHCGQPVPCDAARAAGTAEDAVP